MLKRKQLQTDVEPLFLSIPQVAAMHNPGHSKAHALMANESMLPTKSGQVFYYGRICSRYEVRV